MGGEHLCMGGVGFVCVRGEIMDGRWGLVYGRVEIVCRKERIDGRQVRICVRGGSSWGGGNLCTGDWNLCAGGEN